MLIIQSIAQTPKLLFKFCFSICIIDYFFTTNNFGCCRFILFKKILLLNLINSISYRPTALGNVTSLSNLKIILLPLLIFKYFFLSFFKKIFFGDTSQHGIFPSQRLKLFPLQWKSRVLNTGLTVRSVPLLPCVYNHTLRKCSVTLSTSSKKTCFHLEKNKALEQLAAY